MTAIIGKYSPVGLTQNYKKAHARISDSPEAMREHTIKSAVRSDRAKRRKAPVTLAGPKLEEDQT